MKTRMLNEKYDLKGSIKVIAIMLVMSFFILFFGEAILRQDLLGVFRWIGDYPLSFTFNIIMLFALLMVFTCSFNHLGRGCLATSLIYITVCVISFYKFHISGEYLIPSDILLLGEATSISKEMNITLERNVVINVLLVIFLIVLAFKLDFFNLKRRHHRFIITIVFATLFFTAAGIGASVYEGNDDNKETVQAVVVNEEYNEKGFLVGFSQEVADLIVEKPEGYSKKLVENIMVPYKKKESNLNFKKPNIIMIMSESFFDINRLEHVSFSKNPLQNFESYRKDFAGGNIITAVYGGRTCQTEYEVLTGHSVDFTGTHNMAYMRFVGEDTPSMAKLLKEEGYSTLAIHAYEKQFFSRDVAYKDLGIDNFIASEDFKDPSLARGYISDEEMTNKIIEAYEQKDKEPLFVHAVTMQNHMPYTEPYTANGIEVSSKRLDKEGNNMLTTYANGVADSDKALKELVDYFSKVDEPTIIVMYGDHLPALGDQYDLYKDLGYVQGDFDEQDGFNLYQTPFMMWNNYGLPAKDFGYIDASYLGGKTLEYIGYDKDPYMNFLLQASSQVKAYNEVFALDSEGKLKLPTDLNATELKTINDMWILQYDRLFGEKYQLWH